MVAGRAPCGCSPARANATAPIPAGCGYHVADFLYAAELSWAFAAILLAAMICARAGLDDATAPAALPDAIGLGLAGAVLASLFVPPHRLRSNVDLSGRRPRAARIVVHMLCLTAFLWAAAVSSQVMQLPVRFLLEWSVLTSCLAPGGRLLLWHLAGAMIGRGMLAPRVAIVGARTDCAQAVQQLRRHAMGPRGAPASVELAGLFEIEGGLAAWPEPALPWPIAQLFQRGRGGAFDWVVLAGRDTAPAGFIEALKSFDLNVAVCAEGAPPSHVIGGLNLRLLVPRPLNGMRYLAKLALDRLAAALLLLLLAPLMLCIALIIRLDSRGPALFRQRRHGWNNQVFHVLKFRTMHAADPAAGTGAVQTRRGDRRTTRVGRFLRRSSLDELPQLLNVLRGEMSLVGPRPHPVEMRTEGRPGADLVAHYSQRHRVKPGMTGWAQIHGCRGATETAGQLQQRVALDLYYIEHWSLMMDLRILAQTPAALLRHGSAAF